MRACRPSLRVVVALLAAFAAVELPSSCRAQSELQAPAPPSTCPGKFVPYAAFIAEASRRFAVPVQSVCAVIQVESSGKAHAVSSRGALGLMQIMPGTWVDLSARYNLGIDPFDPHDNIFAGAAYLREMLDRFGSDGFLAAYNAGPQRYAKDLTTGRALPEETLAYLNKLEPLTGMIHRWRDTSVPGHGTNWKRAKLFVPRFYRWSSERSSASALRETPSSKDTLNPHTTELLPHASGLFVPRSGEVKSQ
ncbi:lytic transglycosylase domain-containing protein [Bradyrhizobium sp. 35]|nr:lytic transglycosylase domain-containing protein [Bradyrhizobium sp. 35]